MGGVRFDLVLATVIMAFFINIPEIGGVLQCYKCLSTPSIYYTNETVYMCDDFDYSEKFIVDCPYSTFCTKTISSAKISVLINGTDRDCASQKFVTQQYYNGSWHVNETIKEPYKEGCIKVDDKGARTSSIEHCYCKGNLCNASKTYIRPENACVLLTMLTFLMRNFKFNN